MIERDNILQLNQKINWAPAVAILGPRQCGKTTLAKNFGASTQKEYIYIDLESPSDKLKLEDAESYLQFHKDKLVIIDEVQLMPQLYAILRSVIDSDRRNGRFLLLGSAAPHLVNGVTESLAGRISFLELGPLNIEEISRKGFDWKQHWFKGGFPQAFLTQSELEWEDWMSAFIKTYVERDFKLLFGSNINTVTISKLWQMLAYNQGSIWNAELYANSLGVSAPTANRYFEFLEGAYLVHRLPSFIPNINKRMVKAPKIYIRDSGFVHFINRINNIENLYSHPIIGQSWEGYVIQQIYARKLASTEMHYYRTQNGAEVDIILSKALKPIACIEIKLSNSPVISRGFYNAIKDLNTMDNFVITPNSETYPHKNSLVCSLAYFLKNHLARIEAL